VRNHVIITARKAPAGFGGGGYLLNGQFRLVTDEGNIAPFFGMKIIGNQMNADSVQYVYNVVYRHIWPPDTP
jgi:hypothetical protein